MSRSMAAKMLFERHARLAIASALLFLMALAGCASGEIGDSAETKCVTNEDCAPTETCNTFTGACFVSTNSSNNTNNTNNTNSSNNANSVNNADADMGTRDMAETDMSEVDMSPVVCNPACASNEVCDETGMCVEACMPACQSPSICTEEGCQIPDCQAVGDPCEPSRPDQGQFVCLTQNSEGRCFSKCSDSFAASTCPTGEYCLDVGTTTVVDVCVPSECTTDSDCTAESCINFDNDFGLCFSAGSIAEGDSCSVAANGCVPGTFCRSLTSGSDSGVCSRLCDLFATNPGCPIGEYCGIVFAPRQGLCSDNTTSGVDPFDTCTTSGAFCNDALICIGSTSSRCFKYCRPETPDCDGILPPAGTDAACNNGIFAGDSTIGLCDPPCDPQDANACGLGAVCVDNGYGDFICRRTCTPGNEVQDCCGGNASCRFTCNTDNLCE